MPVQSGVPGLLDSFNHAARAADPSEALMHLLRDCVAQTGAAHGELYLLNLSRNSLTLVGSTRPDASSELSIPLNPSNLSKADSRVRKVLATRQPLVDISPTPSDTGGRGQVLVPILQEDACLGVIRLYGRPPELTRDAVSTTQLVATLAALLIEKRYTLQLLTVMETQISYEQPRDAFLDGLMLLAAEASGFPFIVIRELDKEGTSLECIRAFGFSNVTPADLHLSPISDFPQFEAAITTRTTQELDEHLRHSDSALTDVVESAELQRVVIVPIIVGQAVFGTASFAIACDHNITNLERRGLEAIASSIGGAIETYRNVGLAHEVFFERAKAAAAFTTVEVAQAARHEVRNFVHNAQTNLVTLSKTLKTHSKASPEVAALVDDIFTDLSHVDFALDKIKAISKPLDDARENYDLCKLWHEVLDLVGGRLRAMNVRYAIRGTATIDCIPDRLRHGFLQLVLNSIDSFKESGKKRAHVISVSIEDGTDDMVVIRYSDNGIGLDMAKFAARDGQPGRKITDIFLPGVTTKEGGSGYGLYLARRAVDAHHGSIDLVDYRNGMSFKLDVARRRR